MPRAGSFETKVVIVGGGFSGAAIAARLLRSRQVNVHVIEERPRLGLGLAYGEAQDYQILNVPAGRMGFWTERPTHFLDWAKLRGPQLGWPEAQAATAERLLKSFHEHRFLSSFSSSNGWHAGVIRIVVRKLANR